MVKDTETVFVVDCAGMIDPFPGTFFVATRLNGERVVAYLPSILAETLLLGNSLVGTTVNALSTNIPGFFIVCGLVSQAGEVTERTIATLRREGIVTDVHPSKPIVHVVLGDGSEYDLALDDELIEEIRLHGCPYYLSNIAIDD